MRKRTLLCGLICILLAFSALPAFAGVTLAEGNFVYFGALKHWMAYADSAPETSPSPVLWQVRNTTLDPTKPVLLTHFIVYKYVWKTDATGLTAPLFTTNPNAWNTYSDLKTWLAGGFLADFKSGETAAMSTAFATDVPVDTSAKATLPATDASGNGEIGNTGLFGFIDDTGMEPADSSNSKISIFVNFSLTIEKLHHAPEATQLVVCLTFHVLVYNAFNRDIQYF